MPRRVSLPGASELFRGAPQNDTVLRLPARPEPAEPEPAPVHTERGTERGTERPRRGTGRVKHDEKITVYVSSDELIALEQARLTLRAEHGMGVDRGRIVRTALALALEQLERDGADSELVRRLSS